MRINVTHSIGDLANDLAAIPAQVKSGGATVVRRNGEAGNRSARGFARKAAGPHGKNYFKRLSFEMTGALEGEYGPEGPPKSDYVGVSGSAGAMRDLDKSADVIGPKLARDAGAMLDRLFW